MSKEEILDKMVDVMPFHLPDRMRPYIEEAMQIYLDQELRKTLRAIMKKKKERIDILRHEIVSVSDIVEIFKYEGIELEPEF